MHLSAFLYQFDINGLSTDLRSEMKPILMQTYFVSTKNKFCKLYIL